ncbi:hypothetical protein CALVIDRAFT_532586 [Calocera viscosa TUFC12733]|uniref:Uncharacterized protein n=1 Tax=Calocera viscosa (strain TUFC12733) TaxID=1330018 RepID=A0A167SE36_CALVF|nr:hypothetical protein CALVIDRAFT_532586 [Calocera viscosa TUFC12733]
MENLTSSRSVSPAVRRPSAAQPSGSLTTIRPPTNTIEQLRIDEELIKLEEERQRLHRRQCELLSRRNASAPISRLPDECLSMIFLLAVAEDGVEPMVFNFTSRRIWRERSSYQDVPRLLSHVSARWRAIAVSSPRLWSSFYLQLGKARPTHARFIEGFLERIARTKATPVDIELGAHTALRPGQAQQHDTLQIELDILMTMLPKCRRLKVRMPWRELSRNVVSRHIISNMPQVEELVFYNDRNSTTRMVPAPLGTHKLRSLELAHTELQYVTRSHFNELRSLTMINSGVAVAPSEPDPTELNRMRMNWQPEPDEVWHNHLPLHMLQFATKLNRLTLRAVAITHAENDVPTVTFGDLECLELALGSATEDDEDFDFAQSTSIHSILNILQHIKMPSLRSLTLHGLEYTGMPCGTIFAAMERCNLPLEKLFLKEVYYSANELLDLLARLPRLTTLSLEQGCVSRELLEGMKAQQSALGTRCPVLTELTIKRTLASPHGMEFYRQYTMTALRSMVRSRSISGVVPAISKLVVEDRHLRILRETRGQFKAYVEHLELNDRPTRPARRLFDGFDSEDYDSTPGPYAAPYSPTTSIMDWDPSWDAFDPEDEDDIAHFFADGAPFDWGEHANEMGTLSDESPDDGFSYDFFTV